MSTYNPASAERLVSDPLGGSETILVVDDEAAVRELVTRLLASHGYNVIAATNGAHAIDQAELHAAPIHLVLTDVVMPTMSGRQLFDTLRGWYPTIRVLFMSGYAPGDVSSLALDDIATGFIAKPFVTDELAGAIRRLLDTPRVA